MLTPPGKSLRIASSVNKSQLTRGQKTFNALIKQIEQGRNRLAAWEIAIPRYQQKHAGELQPLIDEAQAWEIKTVHALDRAHGQKGLTKTERRKIANIIVETADDLLAANDDPALKALYNKHSGLDYDEEQASDQATLKNAVEGIFGFDLGDDIDLRSPDRFMAHAQAKLREQQAQQDAARQARLEDQDKRKKSAKQLAKEARKQADEQQLKLSIRESTANSPAPCIPTAKPTRRSASAKPR